MPHAHVLGALALMLAFAAAGPKGGGASGSDVLEDVRRRCAAVSAAAREQRTYDVVLTSDASGFSGGTWRRLGPGQGAAMPRGGQIRATVTFQAGVPVKAVFDAVSPSGDWRNTTEYVFYPDGRTAFRHERHVTLLGPEPSSGVEPPFVLEDRRSYDQSGRLVRTAVEAYAERSRRRLLPSALQRVELPTFEAVTKLPFPTTIPRDQGAPPGGSSDGK